MNAVQQIRNLEAFERIASAEATPIQQAINILLNHEHNEAHRQELQTENHGLGELVDELGTKLQDAAHGLEDLVKQRDEYRAQCERMLKTHNSRMDDANASIAKLDYQVRNLTEELKVLRALNPQRMQKKLKELQAKTKAQTDANAKMQSEVVALRKSHRGVKEIVAQNETLRRDNAVLDRALQKACDDINQQNKTDPLQVIGDWEIHPDESHGKVYIMDKITDVARGFTADGLAKLRAVPPGVQKAAREQLEEIAMRKAGMVDYQEIGK